ncbi:hypothetical protein [Vibrio sp. D431a]|uniref:hypothetical protein n=1 Tax=Vibrio sp. D431a TaxID=2837388 RepID=UPI0025576939|nr:hypothetical protein [Vibrio sp. D431a]MDK9789860.1 hypothetical protein [Vibrio sp. D431a]
MKQKLIWMPKAEKRENGLIFETPNIGTKSPHRLWTLYSEQQKSEPPALPYKPQHLANGFMEERLHDWFTNNGKLHYHTRINQGGNWLLLEYK